MRSRSEYEKAVSCMVGKQLQRVRYFEVDYASETICSLSPFDGDQLDYGCDLEMSDGTIFGIIWDGEFHQYGVGVFSASLAEQLTEPRRWDVTHSSGWTALIGQSIVKVTIYWSWVESVAAGRVHFPQDLELEFESGTLVYLSASHYDKKKDVLCGLSDDISVVFGIALARKYRIGPYASE